MGTFRFAIMGAAHIAHKFCEAVQLLEDCEVVAVSSKSMERAEQFAKAHNISNCFDSYEKMLKEIKVDCVYIAVTQDAHYELSMLCLDYRVPVLCEKAMFLNSRQAGQVFHKAREKGVFVMEAMWSRFLPAIRTAKRWLQDGAIGEPVLAEFAFGFCAPKDNNNRFFSPKLGGGVAYDLTVYAYELTTYLINQSIQDYTVQAIWSESGVDVSNQISIRFANALAVLHTSFITDLEDKLVIYGEKGKIIIPSSHTANEALLYGEQNKLIQHFEDANTQNGFIYEIKEAMECIRAGKTESSTVPQELTLQCARLFDRILETK